ncbi:MAG: tetratricopeptide repeat protein [Bacteroidota bacterium]
MKKIFYLALVMFNFITACSNESSQELLGSGDAKAKAGEFKAAISDYDKAIEQDPGNIQAIFHRANTKTCITDFAGAIEDYSKVIQLDPKDANAYSCRGNSKRITCDYKGAIADFDNAIKFNIREPAKVYQLRGFCKMGTSDMNGAMTDLDKAIELNPKLPDAYLYRGKLKLKNGVLTEACADLATASGLGQKEADDLIKKNCK